MRTHRAGESGFSLMETMIALAVLATGLLATAQVMAFSMGMSKDSGDDLLARQKATESIESVFTARDNHKFGVNTWSQIRNIIGETGSDNGVFRDGFQPLTPGGADGLVNTADDGVVLQSIKQPGPDGQLGTVDDVDRFLTNFQRKIEITAVAGNPNLRRIRVTIQYRGEGRTREFVIDTFISAFA